MATAQPFNPGSQEPAPTRAHIRRSSSRKSFASSLSRSGSQIELPRTACPKDGDAFSYDPSHLPAWILSQELWGRLPVQVQSALAAVQHAGAAVLTGFERLDKQNKQRMADEDLLVKLDDLPPPKYRTVSDASSMFQSDTSPILSAGSSASPSSCTSPATRASSFSQGLAANPCSPISLGPAADPLASKRDRSRDRSFSTPLEPNDAYYATELSHLRTAALPRLRHQARKVDTEWYEAKRTNSIVAEEVDAFEQWWKEKKVYISRLNEDGKRKAADCGLTSTGMGWSAS